VQPPTFPAVLEHPKTVALRQLLQEKFSPEELRELCQSIRVDYEDIGRPKQLELVQYCGRRSMHGQLLTAMYNARPDLRSELQQFASSGSSSSSSAGAGYTQASASRPAPPPSSGSGSTSSTGTAPNIERAMEEVLGWDANAYYMFAKLIGMSSVRPNQSQRNYIDQIRDYSGTKANDRQTVNRIMSAFHVIKALTTAFNSSGIDGLAFDCANQHYDDVRSVHASPTKAVMLAYYIQQKGNKQQFLRTFQSENPHQYTHFALGDPQNTLILDR
jgi:hypothetical protein